MKKSEEFQRAAEMQRAKAKTEPWARGHYNDTADFWESRAKVAAVREKAAESES